MNIACQHGGSQARTSTCSCSHTAGDVPSKHFAGARKRRAQVAMITDLREFDFSNIVIRQAVDVVLCPAHRVLAYTRVRLSVRVHALTMSAGQSLSFFVWNALPSDEDPAQEFIESSPLMTATITSSTAAPTLVTSGTSYDPNAYLKISIRAVQSPTSTPPLRATLSTYLLLRD